MIQAKVVRGLCGEPYCRNRRVKDRRRCFKHTMSRWRRANPIKASYFTLRDHARERGIIFTISFAEFELFALASSYATTKGQRRHSLTVDRIEESKGYISGNIQPMTRTDNIEKYHATRKAAGAVWKHRKAA